MSIERAIDREPLILSTNYDFSVTYEIYDTEGLVDFTTYTYTADLCESDGTKVKSFTVTKTVDGTKAIVEMSLPKEDIANLSVGGKYVWDLKATITDEIKILKGTAIVERGFTQ